jgi:triacylglycerol lipase
MWWWMACVAPVEGPPAATGVPAVDSADTSEGDTAEGTSASTPPVEDPLPILFIHGINGHADNWASIRGHLADDGWPPELLFAQTFDDPAWGCNVDNAATIDRWVDAILAETGAPQIQLVAHSMGTLSSRSYVKNLGGTDTVRQYITLGGMHHGLQSSCSPDFPFKPCVWDEICSSGDLVTQLNAEPSTPGPTTWVSIYGTADADIPNSSSILDGAENIAVPGVEHDGPNGLQETAATYRVLKEVLLRP